MADKPEQKAELASNQPADNINVDRLELFKDFDTVSAGNPEGTPLTEGAVKQEPDELVFDDPFKAAGVSTPIAGASEKSKPPTNPENSIDPSGTPPGRGDVSTDIKSDLPVVSRDSLPKPAGPFSIVSRPDKLDPNAPTAVFLDQFDRNDIDLGDGTRVPHGEISRRAAQANGFNAFGLQINPRETSTGATDYAEALKGIEKSIDSGELPLGRGDVINISLGQSGPNEPTFEEASKFLGFEVTPENLKDQRQKILTRMGEIANDPTRPAADRETARRVVDTNEAISRLQGRGIEVIQAAGNEGSNKFSWDFMNANWQLSSVKPSGKADPFSASHSLATPGDGVLPVKHNNQLDMFDPTPIENQKGHFEVGGAKFKATGSSLFQSNAQVFNRETQELGKPMPFVRPESPQLGSEILFGQPDVLSKFEGRVEIPKHFSRIRPFDSFSLQFSKTPGPGETAVTKVIDGTSFANIGFLKDNFDRLKALKKDR
jgi:hypothetical protein